jgi:hypothetical protein
LQGGCCVWHGGAGGVTGWHGFAGGVTGGHGGVTGGHGGLTGGHGGGTTTDTLHCVELPVPDESVAWIVAVAVKLPEAL